jgi:CBS domain containing-hemolysin-like protein
MTATGLFFLLIFSISLSAFFSGMEIAFLASNKLRIELDKKQGKPYCKMVDIFLRRPNEFISAMLMGNNITLVVYGVAMARLFSPLIEKIITSKGGALVIETIFATLVILITAEWLPKTSCRLNPNAVLRRFSWLAYGFYLLLYPLTAFVTFLAKILLRLVGVKLASKAGETLFSRADLMQLSSEVSRSQDEENEYEHDIEIFQNALDFYKVRIHDCMVPRTEIAAIEEHQPVKALQEMFVRTGYSRIPVYSETIDKIIGYVHSKDLFKGMASIREKLRPVDFVPESMPAQNLLASFIKNKKALAVVVDEFGGTAGMVTMEDIFEEIFGEINDEHDSDNLIDKQLSENEFIFSGRMEIKYINRAYGLNIPDKEEYETLAGYIMYHNESIPHQQEVLQFGCFRFRILRTSATKIELVKLSVIDD